MRVQVLVLPVFKRQWLFHAWYDNSKDGLAQAEVLDWRNGSTLAEKFGLLQKAISMKARDTIQQQWQAMESAQEGTFQHKLYILAQWVLEREDPLESFLKSVPKETTSFDINYPLGWGLLTAPQLPLVLTPLPNVTLYYSVYRLVGHYQAMQGASALQKAFKRLDTAQVTALNEVRQRALQERGAVIPRQKKRYFRDVAKLLFNSHNPEPLPVFKASQKLEELVRPLERWETPLPEQAANKLVEHYQVSGLSEILGRSRRKALRSVEDSKAWRRR